jgi:hypothetical protein
MPEVHADTKVHSDCAGMRQAAKPTANKRMRLLGFDGGVRQRQSSESFHTGPGWSGFLEIPISNS